jgi:hypothetical protein
MIIKDTRKSLLFVKRLILSVLMPKKAKVMLPLQGRRLKVPKSHQNKTFGKRDRRVVLRLHRHKIISRILKLFLLFKASHHVKSYQ